MLRQEWPCPGDLLHVDIKKLGKIGRIGYRVRGDSRTRVRGIGWEYVHVAIDDGSRVACAEIQRDETSATTAAFLQRALVWYATLGVTVRALLSDNGSAYRSRGVAALLVAHGVAHRFTRPYTPRTNGKAERFIQTLLREWAYVRPYPSSYRRAQWLDRYLDHYNHARAHSSLTYLPPMLRLAERR